MPLKSADYLKLIEIHLEEWTRKSTSEKIVPQGPGCFVWHYEEDKKYESSGMFYTRDMVPKHFSGEMAARLGEIIEEADHEHEVVVGCIFEDKSMVLRLRKKGHQEIVRSITSSKVFHTPSIPFGGWTGTYCVSS
jgi:hypothetical protein